MKKCIDFDSRFADFTSRWMKEHGKEYRNFDAMEADMPRVYMTFLNTPARWLDGVTPGAYFTQFEDPKDLVDWMVDYVRKYPGATSLRSFFALSQPSFFASALVMKFSGSSPWANR